VNFIINHLCLSNTTTKKQLSICTKIINVYY